MSFPVFSVFSKFSDERISMSEYIKSYLNLFFISELYNPLKIINGRTGTIEIPWYIYRGLDRYSGYDGFNLGPRKEDGRRDRVQIVRSK
jgi:hypothetical protein